MATPTLGNVPSFIHYCETDDWTASDGTDGEIKKQGTYAIAWVARGSTGDQTQWDRGSGIDLTGQHFRIWINHAAIPYLDPESGGGFQVGLSSDNSNWAYWTLFGSDTYEGGWFNGIIDCDSTPTSGSFTKTSVRYYRLLINTSGLAANKVNTWYDYLSYGDGYYATGGTSGDEIDLAGMLAQDIANGYGMLLRYEGIYFAYGELQIGNGATTTWFEMLDEVLVFTSAPVASSLYSIRGEGAGCRINIDNSVIRAAGSAVWSLDMDDSNLLVCTITATLIGTNGGAVSFKSGQTITDDVFDGCGTIAAGGADMTGSIVKGYEGSSDSSALSWNVATDPDGYLDEMSFVKGTASTHAIEFGTSAPTSITLRGIDFSGYNASNGQTDSTFYVAATGGSVSISLVECTGNVSYKSAGATVTISSDVTMTVTVKDQDGVAVVGAQVAVYRESDDTELMNEDTIAGGVATESVNYPGSDFAVYIRVRKSSTGDTRYVPAVAGGVVTDTGMNVTVTLREEAIA